MDRRKKGECMGALGAFVVHVGVIALFILVSFDVPQPDEEAGGIPVVMGNVSEAQGFDDPSLVDVDVLDEEAPPPADPAPELPSEQELLTQEEEETVAIKPKTEKPKEKTVKPKEVVKPKESVKKPEKTEAEKAAEAKRLAAEKAERERKAAEEAARKRVANAFGKGAKMEGSKGNAAGVGSEGNPKGNAAAGSMNGSGGDASFDLGGRSLGKGTALPLPVYNVQEEGRVVVEITVNPAGQVVAVKISPKTNTVNARLRKAAMDAARKARFEEIKGLTNQMGTITYNFKLR